MKKIVYLFLISVALWSCSNSKTKITDFNPFSNYKVNDDTLFHSMDLSQAIHEGIAIPSKNDAVSNEYFDITFDIQNGTGEKQKFYYAVYYQNESYKHEEIFTRTEIKFTDTASTVPDTLRTVEYNPFCAKNFYGSWENTSEEFHITEEIPGDNKPHTITDKIRILGNPRNEEKFFGPETEANNPTQEQIAQAMENIRNNTEWYESIKKKAEANKFDPEKQLFMDALWSINHDIEKRTGNKNNRWKRNPRVGNYNFILVVAAKSGYDALPSYIKNISKKDSLGNFVSPFYYFTKNFNDIPENVWVVQSQKVLNTKAAYNMSSGIYINMLEYQDPNVDESNFNDYCGSSAALYKNAQFQQHFQSINKDYRLRNIPLKHDVVHAPYTLAKFKANKEKYENSEELLETYASTSDCPCKTVSYDKNTDALKVVNPGNEEPPYKKENVALKARVGFTYGKYTAKIKFPKLLNEENVWNGLTSAFWLIYHSNQSWNNRDVCNGKGYIPKAADNMDRVSSTFYSEIDIEIVKTSKFWPKGSYHGAEDYPQEDASENDNLIVACTNWDLACPDQDVFLLGVHDFAHKGDTFTLHRWHEGYQAVTLKTESKHSETVSDVYYYQIDWQPEHITWRIGTTKENLKVVGYMDKTVTNIPNNQMVPVMSQEFHYGEWWPATPFHQNFIPFPESDLVGEIHAIEVE